MIDHKKQNIRTLVKLAAVDIPWLYKGVGGGVCIHLSLPYFRIKNKEGRV